MAKPQVTKETLKAMAQMSGLELSDEKLEELLPQIQRTVEALGGLGVLDLQNVEPAIVFKPDDE